MAPETPPRPDRRQALIAAAYQRIANDGFEGLRTRDVAADVGVNIATLHYYFPTKEALICGVIGHGMQRFTQTMPGEGSPAEQLAAIWARSPRCSSKTSSSGQSWVSWCFARHAIRTSRASFNRRTTTGIAR